MRDVYGVEQPEAFISFEDMFFLGHTSFIDGYIPETKVLIEQKALGKDLTKPIKQSDGTLLTPFQQAKRYRRGLIDLFKILDQEPEKRDPYLDKDLKAFPYVNGGLFNDENIEIPQFMEKIKNLLLAKASDDFNWAEISPTIFGAVFESTLKFYIYFYCSICYNIKRIFLSPKF